MANAARRGSDVSHGQKAPQSKGMRNTLWFVKHKEVLSLGKLLKFLDYLILAHMKAQTIHEYANKTQDHNHH